MDNCARCGADLGVGRFCLNCGHPVGAPVAPGDELVGPRAALETDASAGAAYDLDDDLLPGRSWLAWVGAAVAVLVLLVVLASCLGGGAEPASDQQRTTPGATSQETGSAPQDSPSDEPDLGRKRNLARTAVVTVPATARPTTDLDGEVVDYEAENMLDGDPRTAWRMPGDGTGREVTLRVQPGFAIVEVGLVNGYAKQVGGVDWYPNNRRVEAVAWIFDDGSSSRQVLIDQRIPQTRRIVATASREVRLVLESVSEPGDGSLGRDYTAISDVVVVGRRIR